MIQVGSMMRSGLASIAALTLGGCALVGIHDRPPTAAERGHATARRACAPCHAVEPGRDSPRREAPPLASNG